MGRLIDNLRPCSVCGNKPKICDTYEMEAKSIYGTTNEHDYKLFCSENGVHNSAGSWYNNKYKACLDWNRRQYQNENGKTFSSNLGDKLLHCPFCGRKMVFHREEHVNKNSHKIVEQYYMHDVDGSQSNCLLDDIFMPFTIGAGDADPESGYIGEYAARWNARAISPLEKSNVSTVENHISDPISPVEKFNANAIKENHNGRNQS